MHILIYVNNFLKLNAFHYLHFIFKFFSSKPIGSCNEDASINENLYEVHSTSKNQSCFSNDQNDYIIFFCIIIVCLKNLRPFINILHGVL